MSTIIDAGSAKTDLPAKASEQAGRFALLVDLGIITVPDDYDQATWLATFLKRNFEKLDNFNDNITDANFSNPSRILKPGDRLRVRAFKPVVVGTTTSEEWMDFLRRQKAVFTGAQGASLVFEQKRNQLPKDKWYASFDEKERLLYTVGRHGVPLVVRDSDGNFGFRLGSFEDGWFYGTCSLCFCDE